MRRDANGKIIVKPAWRKCKLCGGRYDIFKAKNLFIHPYCPAWPIWNRGELVPMNMYDIETQQEYWIDSAWEAKVRSITMWQSGFSEFKIECSKCGEWFLSMDNVPGSCYQCATVKEEL